MEIIKTWNYHQRIIFFVKIFGKYQLFYRSSGLAGHNSKGEILPTYLLKTFSQCIGDEFNEMPYGWLPKIFKFNHWRSYYTKDPKYFLDEMQKYFNILKEVNMEHEEENDPVKINDFIKRYVKDDDDFLDWAQV